MGTWVKTRVLVAAWTTLCALPLAVEAEEGAAGDLLFVCQDESTIEQQVRRYLKEKYDIDATMRYLDDEDTDLMLVYALSPRDEGVPDIKFFVDTMISARDTETREVNERCLKINAYFILPDTYKTETWTRRIQTLNDDWHRRQWMPHRVYLDKDNDIAMESFINIPSRNVPVHADMVYDLLVRSLNAWSAYYLELSKLLDL